MMVMMMKVEAVIIQQQGGNRDKIQIKAYALGDELKQKSLEKIWDQSTARTSSAPLVFLLGLRKDKSAEGEAGAKKQGGKVSWQQLVTRASPESISLTDCKANLILLAHLPRPHDMDAPYIEWIVE